MPVFIPCYWRTTGHTGGQWTQGYWTQDSRHYKVDTGHRTVVTIKWTLDRGQSSECSLLVLPLLPARAGVLGVEAQVLVEGGALVEVQVIDHGGGWYKYKCK